MWHTKNMKRKFFFLKKSYQTPVHTEYVRMCVPVLCLRLNKTADRFGVVLAVFYHRLLSISTGDQLSMFKVLDEPLSLTWVYLVILHVPTRFPSLFPSLCSLSVHSPPSIHPPLSLSFFVFFPSLNLSLNYKHNPCVFPTICQSCCFFPGTWGSRCIKQSIIFVMNMCDMFHKTSLTFSDICSWVDSELTRTTTMKLCPS